MAHDNLNLLNSDKPLAHEDDKQTLYTKEARNQERVKIQQYIDDNCVNSPAPSDS
ncbi:MAG: hypothetical protein IMF12_01985 [Proteobacteria bacterium]|nr:hypothetical protein [Pseudomonadota bacterium]